MFSREPQLINPETVALKLRIIERISSEFASIGSLRDSFRIRDTISQILFETEKLPELLSFSDRCQIRGAIKFLCYGICHPQILSYISSNRESEVLVSSQEIAVECLTELILIVSGDANVRSQFKTTRSKQIYRLCQLHTSSLVDISSVVGSSLHSFLQCSALQYLGIRKTDIRQLSDLINGCVSDINYRIKDWEKAYKQFRASRLKNDDNSSIWDFLDSVGITVNHSIVRQKSDEMEDKDWQNRLESEFVDAIQYFFSQIDAVHSLILSSARSIEIIDMIDADLSLELEREEFASPLEFLRIFHDKYEKRLCGIILPPPPEATVSQYRHDQSSVKKKQSASLWMWHSSHEIEQRDIVRDCVFVNGESCVETSSQNLSLPNKKKKMMVVSEPQSVISLVRWHIASRVANIMASNPCRALTTFMSIPQAVDLLMDRVLIAASRTVASGDALIVLNKLFGGDGLSLMSARRYQSYSTKSTKSLTVSPDCHHIWIDIHNIDRTLHEFERPSTPTTSLKQDQSKLPVPSPGRRVRSRSLGEDEAGNSKNDDDNSSSPKPLDIVVSPTISIDDSYVQFDQRSQSAGISSIPSEIFQNLLIALNDDKEEAQNVEIQVSVVDYFDLVRNVDLDSYSSWASSIDYCKTIQPTSTASLLHLDDMMSSSSSRSDSFDSTFADTKQLIQSCPLPYLMSFKTQVLTIIPVPGTSLNCDMIENSSQDKKKNTKEGPVRKIFIHPVFGM